MDYSEKVMDHFANPRNCRKMEEPDGVGTVGNPTVDSVCSEDGTVGALL